MAHELERLLAAGQLKIGDELYHPYRRHAEEVTARIVADGVEVGGRQYPSVSTAAKETVGYAANGWTFWRHRGTGRPLSELRSGVQE